MFAPFRSGLSWVRNTMVFVLLLSIGVQFGLFKPDAAAQAELEDRFASPPDAALIEVSEPANDFVTITGRSGSVPGDALVHIVNLSTAEFVETRSNFNGSFQARVPGVAHTAFEINATLNPFEGRTAVQDFVGTPATIVYSGQPQSHADGSVDFTLSGNINRNSGHFVIAAQLQQSEIDSRDPIVINGNIAITSPAINSSFDSRNHVVVLGLFLTPLNRADGEHNLMPFDHSGYSPLLTVTGLGINGVGNRIYIGEVVVQSSQFTRQGNRINAEFQLNSNTSYRLPDGYYTLAIDAQIGPSVNNRESLLENSLLAAPSSSDFQGESLPPWWTHAVVKVGEPDIPRLPWALLWNTVSAGSRGKMALEDESVFSLRNKIVFDSERFILPMVDEVSGKAISYRLEPFLPSMFQNNKSLIHPPVLSLQLPGGQLQVRVEKPDGTADDLGSAQFRQYRLGLADPRRPSTLFGETSVMTPLELTTMSDQFNYAFTQYGRHIIHMTGEVEDVQGNVYEGGGRYEVWIAKPLNVVELGVFLGTPFEVGDYYSPTVRVEPGVPAEVEIDFRLHVNSSEQDVVQHQFTGTANTYGYFHPATDNPYLQIPAPGEYIVDVNASYWSPDGTLWMGGRRGANVVETPNSPLIAHGRRGMDRVHLPDRPQWFFYNNFEGLFNSIGASSPDFTFPVPFHSGDVVWAADKMFDRVGNGEIVPLVRLQDTRGNIAADIVRRLDGFEHGIDGDIRTLAQIGEMPMFTHAPISTQNPVPNAADYRLWSYFYHVTMRPGVAVRAILDGDDHGGVGKYWTFGDPYNLQPGSGPNGDLPGDIKLMFGGGVYRDLDKSINEYVIHGSMAVIIDNDDPMGERTAPPFRGAGGGPNGGPLLVIQGEEIDLFITPTGVRPGEVLEVGDTFSFAGQFWPLLPSKLGVEIVSPSGQRRQIEGMANKIGYFYDPNADFVLDKPGVWSVNVQGIHDSLISAGPVESPFPTGGVLGSDSGNYYFYVVPESEQNPDLKIDFVQSALSPLDLFGDVPAGWTDVGVSHTLTMPGFILDQGEITVTDGTFSYQYDPIQLNQDFPNLDIRDQSNEGPTPQSVDTITLTFFIEGVDQSGRRVQIIRRALLEGEALIQVVDTALTFTPPLENMALNKPVRVSRSLNENPPGMAVDGDFNNWWGAGDGPPQWIEIDLQTQATVEAFRLAISQFPEGQTVHRLEVKSARNDSYHRVHEFRGFTRDTEVLEFIPAVPLEDVRFVRVETTSSPSWVAWREIVVVGRASADSGPAPDSDGDGVPDEEDLCPTFPGSPDLDGC